MKNLTATLLAFVLAVAPTSSVFAKLPTKEAVQDMISQQQEILAAKRAIIDDLKRQIDELNEKRDKQKLVRNVSLAAGIIVGGAVGLSKARSTNAIDPILYGIIGTVIGLTGATVAAVDQVFFINTTTDKLDELAQNLEIAEKILSTEATKLELMESLLAGE